MVHDDGTVRVVGGEQNNPQESVLSFRLLEALLSYCFKNFNLHYLVCVCMCVCCVSTCHACMSKPEDVRESVLSTAWVPQIELG